MEQKKILVVEDKDMHIDAARFLLSGHDVDIATNLVEALDKLEDSESSKYDVLLTDLHFPWDHWGRKSLSESQQLGYPLVFRAAQLEVPYIGIVTDQNHHAGPLAELFSMLTSRVGYLEHNTFSVKESQVRFFDERSLPRFFYHDGEILNRTQYRKLNKKRGGTLDRIPAKNWGAALEMLVDPNYEYHP